MKQDSQNQRAGRGIAILVAMLLIAILIFNLDVVVDRFRGYVDLVAVVTETSDVRVGASVWAAGLEVGQVTGMELVDAAAFEAVADRAGIEEEAAVAIHLRLQDRAREVVREGSRAYTAKQRLIGSPIVRIEAAPPDSPPVESGDTLYPADRPSIEHLVERGRAFPSALDSLVAGLRTLNQLSDDRGPAIDRLVDRVGVVTAEAESLRSALEGGNMGRWLDDPELGERLEALQLRVAGLSEAAGALGRYGDGELREGASSLARRADRLGEELSELEERLARGSGFVPRLRRDSALAVALHGVQAQIDSLRAEGLGFALRMFVP